MSEDIEDRRGEGSGGSRGFGGGATRLGLGGFALLLVGSFIFKQDLFSLFGFEGAAPTQSPQETEQTRAAQKPLADLVSFVLDDVQKVWAKELPATTSTRYEHAKLVLFTAGTESGCGYGQSAMGPFYCPEDRTVYIDLSFYTELKEKFKASGDFAEMYVIAHELGHHVQNLLGISDRVQREQQNDPSRKNELSVKLELQADCLAGVWGHTTEQRKMVDGADVEDALRAASAIGDDRLQRRATGQVHPETWTHGSSAQRAAWFKRGLDSGRVSGCNTFAAAAL